jgi:hypothetical protein
MNKKTKILLTAALLGTAVNSEYIIKDVVAASSSDTVSESEIKDLIKTPYADLVSGKIFSAQDFSNSKVTKKKDLVDLIVGKFFPTTSYEISSDLSTKFPADYEGALKAKDDRVALYNKLITDNTFIKTLSNNIKKIPNVTFEDTKNIKDLIVRQNTFLGKTETGASEDNKTILPKVGVNDLDFVRQILEAKEGDLSGLDLTARKKIAEWATMATAAENAYDAKEKEAENKIKVYIASANFKQSIDTALAEDALEDNTSSAVKYSDLDTSGGLVSLKTKLSADASNLSALETDRDSIKNTLKTAKLKELAKKLLDDYNNSTVFESEKPYYADNIEDIKASLSGSNPLLTWSDFFASKASDTSFQTLIDNLNKADTKTNRDVAFDALKKEHERYIATTITPIVIGFKRDSELDALKKEITALATTENDTVLKSNGYNDLLTEADFDAIVTLAKSSYSLDSARDVTAYPYTADSELQTDINALKAAWKTVTDKVSATNIALYNKFKTDVKNFKASTNIGSKTLKQYTDHTSSGKFGPAGSKKLLGGRPVADLTKLSPSELQKLIEEGDKKLKAIPSAIQAVKDSKKELTDIYEELKKDKSSVSKNELIEFKEYFDSTEADTADKTLTGYLKYKQEFNQAFVAKINGSVKDIFSDKAVLEFIDSLANPYANLITDKDFDDVSEKGAAFADFLLKIMTEKGTGKVVENESDLAGLSDSESVTINVNKLKGIKGAGSSTTLAADEVVIKKADKDALEQQNRDEKAKVSSLQSQLTAVQEEANLLKASSKIAHLSNDMVAFLVNGGKVFTDAKALEALTDTNAIKKAFVDSSVNADVSDLDTLFNDIGGDYKAAYDVVKAKAPVETEEEKIAKHNADIELQISALQEQYKSIPMAQKNAGRGKIVTEKTEQHIKIRSDIEELEKKKK